MPKLFSLKYFCPSIFLLVGGKRREKGRTKEGEEKKRWRTERKRRIDSDAEEMKGKEEIRGSYFFFYSSQRFNYNDQYLSNIEIFISLINLRSLIFYCQSVLPYNTIKTVKDTDVQIFSRKHKKV